MSGRVQRNAIAKQANYQFKCPRCGHPIRIYWEDPLEERDTSMLFAVECLRSDGGCGIAATLPASCGWPIRSAAIRSRSRLPRRRRSVGSLKSDVGLSGTA